MANRARPRKRAFRLAGYMLAGIALLSISVGLANTPAPAVLIACALVLCIVGEG